jgi:hypothetical protein
MRRNCLGIARYTIRVCSIDAKRIQRFQIDRPLPTYRQVTDCGTNGGNRPASHPRIWAKGHEEPSRNQRRRRIGGSYGNRPQERTSLATMTAPKRSSQSRPPCAGP